MIRFLLVITLIATAIPAMAQNSGLRRLTDRDDLFGWEAVGRLDIEGSGFCTGTLIAPDIVLTAAHCAYDKRTGQHYPADKVRFRAGLRDGVSIAERQVTQIVTPPEYQPRGPHTLTKAKVDVALMKLAEPIPTSVASPFALHTGKLTSEEISVSSYGQGRTEAISRQRSCQMLLRQEGLIAFDCNVTFGSSGSAILTRIGPRLRVLSVVSGGGTYEGRKIGFGMELPNIVSGLKRELRKTASGPKASIKRLQVGSDRGGTGAKFVRPNGS